MSSQTRELRLAEVIAALSLATDLGMGQPLEKALRTALLAVNIGGDLGYPPDVLRDCYYLALLWHVGCTADAYEFALWMGGDDIAWRSVSAALPSASNSEALRHLIASVGRGRSLGERVRLVAGMQASGQQRFQSVIASHCDAGVTLCRRLGLPDEVVAGIGQIFERWDGHGHPSALKGEQLSPAFRLVQVAHDVELLARLGGADTALSVVRKRRGGAYDPTVCDGFLAHGTNLLAELPAGSAWQAAIEAEPMPRLSIPESRLDDLAIAFAEWADLKSPFTLGHSTGVAGLAEAAAEALG
jgi:HD-GYP domain-containing protein (c-di-GMP phosphodiesterase class II)